MLFFKKLRNVLKIAEKPSEIYWVLFAELRQNQEDPASLRSTDSPVTTPAFESQKYLLIILSIDLSLVKIIYSFTTIKINIDM